MKDKLTSMKRSLINIGFVPYLVFQMTREEIEYANDIGDWDTLLNYMWDMADKYQFIRPTGGYYEWDEGRL